MRQRYVQFLPLVVVVDVDVAVDDVAVVVVDVDAADDDVVVVAVDDGEAIVDEVGGKNMPLTPLQIVAG